MVQRAEEKGKSRVKAMVVPNHRAAVLLPKIYQNVEPGSKCSPMRCAPTGCWTIRYLHKFVDHSVRYVDGKRAYEQYRELLELPEADH